MDYLDTSVLAAYYCPESISDKAEELIIQSSSPAISYLSEVELVSAISRKIREKSFSREVGNKILNQFHSHVSHNLFRWVPVEHHHFQQAMTWIAQFNNSLCTLDSLHLAIASSENAIFITADSGLAKAAKNFGVDFILVK